MATWVEPIESQTDPDAPLTSDLAKQWSNNVIAAFDGEAGAPRLARKVVSGDSGGNLSFTNVGEWQGLIGNFYMRSAIVQVALSDDGVSYGATTALNPACNPFGIMDIYIDFLTGDYVSCGFVDNGGGGGSVDIFRQTGTIAGFGSGVSAVRFSTSGDSYNCLVEFNGGNSAS